MNKLGAHPERWEAFCEAIKDSNLKSLDLNFNGLGGLDTKRWQAFCQAIKDSKLHSLRLNHNGLYTLNPEQWKAFCQAIKSSKLQSLELMDNQQDKWNPERWLDLFNAIEDNFSLQLEISSSSYILTQEIQSFITRNTKIKSASQLAEKALENAIPSYDTIIAFKELASAIDLLEGKETQNANTARESLIELQGKLLSQIFQHEYVNSLALNEEPTQVEKRSAFFEAMLNLLDDEKHFFKLDSDSQTLFDRILLQAAGMYVPMGDALTDEQRVTLLQYVVLTHIERIQELKATSTSTSSSTPIFFASQSLPRIETLQHLKIDDAWQELTKDKSSLSDKLKDIIAAISTNALKINEPKSTAPKK
jgi:hypothetical protein